MCRPFASTFTPRITTSSVSNGESFAVIVLLNSSIDMTGGGMSVAAMALFVGSQLELEVELPGLGICCSFVL